MTELLLADEASMCALATSVTERNAKPNFLSKPILLRRLERLRLLGRDRIGERFQVRHQRRLFVVGEPEVSQNAGIPSLIRSIELRSWPAVSGDCLVCRRTGGARQRIP